ncbi:MAG: hypothetical protein JWN86_2880 [Planctomycetota bacterium]|nr:hypothetical protein [Planctomycetota bacterium]
MQDRERIGKRTAAVLLAAIVIGSSALAVRWAFLVPIYQSPDEQTHLDYALALRDGGRFFRAAPFGSTPAGVPAHPWTGYLLDSTQPDTYQFNSSAKMPVGYGTRAYFRRLDRDAPPLASIKIVDPPMLAVVYPYGYYLALAGWLKVVTLFSAKLSVTFFAARLFSVFLLACSLVFGYLAARELRIGRLAALVATGIVGFFPMTSFIASYTQPDNLSFTLLSLGFYLGLRTARRGGRVLDLATLGLCWGYLLVTKPHYCACLVAASLPMLATRIRWRRWPMAVVLLALPAVPLWGLFLWILHDTPSYYSEPAAFPDVLACIVIRLGNAFRDFFQTTTHVTFWGVFGCVDAPFEMTMPLKLSVTMRFLAMGGTFVVLALTLVRLERITSRLTRVVAAGHWRRAIRIAASDPVMNTYFLFFVLMLYAYVRMDNRFAAQGRNWIPLMLPVMLTAIHFAPRALTLRRTRTAVSVVVGAALVAYVSVGSVYGLRTIKKRYYLPIDHYAVRPIHLPQTPSALNQMTWSDGKGDATGADSYVAYVLPKAQYVQGVEIRLLVNNPQHDRAMLKVSWANRQDPSRSPASHVETFYLPSGTFERTLTVPINEAVELIRIHPDIKPCHIEVKSVLFHQPVRRLAMK